jgi:alpha-tubulin suppressor-like RCC1 family protein
MAKRWPVLCGVLLVAAPGAFVWLASSKPDANRVQHLADGSLFSLSRISFNDTNVFTHGKWLERNLGNLVPSNGLSFGPVHLQRRTFEAFEEEDSRGLILEFKRLTTNAPGQIPLAARWRREVRCLILGDDGSEYRAEFHRLMNVDYSPLVLFENALHPVLSGGFFNSASLRRPEGDFEYLTATGFPRASAWLTVRIESREAPDQAVRYRHWEPLAQFKVRNPACSQPRAWQPALLPAAKEIDGLQFVLGDITVHPQQPTSAQETDHAVTITFQVRSNGVVQYQWRVFSFRLEDALGNFREPRYPFHPINGWLAQLGDRPTLDPRQPWKVEADFVPIADVSSSPIAVGEARITADGLDPQSLCKIRVPATMGATFLTKFHNVSLRITQAGGRGTAAPQSLGWDMRPAQLRRDTTGARQSLDYCVQIMDKQCDWRILSLALSRQQMIGRSSLLLPSRNNPEYFAVPYDGTGDVELVFAVVKNYHVEFIVKPNVADRPNLDLLARPNVTDGGTSAQRGAVMPDAARTNLFAGARGDVTPPAKPSTPARRAAKIASGFGNLVVVKADGSLWSMGRNGGQDPSRFGYVGDGTTVDRESLVRLSAENDWTDVACGDGFSLALKSDGSLWGWGANRAGALGDEIGDHNRPVSIGPDCDWAKIDAVGLSSYAIKSNGALWAWGKCDLGQSSRLPVHLYAPVQVGRERDWRAVASSQSHTFAIKTDGTLWAWQHYCGGYQVIGQARDDGGMANSRPLQIGTARDWAAVAVGHGRSAALKIDGSMWLWTWDIVGQNDTTGEVLQKWRGRSWAGESKSGPEKVLGANDWATVGAGVGQFVATKTDGTLWSMGLQLGGTVLTRSDFLGQIGSDADWTWVGAGDLSSFAVKSDGSLWLWGRRLVGFGADPSPVKIAEASEAAPPHR